MKDHFDRRLSRRHFLRLSALGGSAALGGLGFPRALSGSAAALWGPDDGERNALRFAPVASPQGLRLGAAPGIADIGGGVQAQGWLINQSLPSPLLRVRRGERFDVTLENGLPENLILHWHGLTPPEAADGHPRLAVPKGASYHYAFEVQDRAGTYWYHSHTHHRVAQHTQKGIAGMIIVEDDEEAALGLPSGEREIPLILQDRRLNVEGMPFYSDANLMEGYTGSEPFGNGVRRPYLEVDSALYRLRLLNGSNARIFRLEWSDGRPLILIGTDGGLLERPITLETLDLAPGERVDLLTDLSNLRSGQKVMLRSRPFEIPGRVNTMGVPNPHGIQLDLLELRITREVRETARIPQILSSPGGPDPRDSVGERIFRFSLLGPKRSFIDTHVPGMHHINGKQFEMDQVEERVPFGKTEIWSFVNDDWFAHPVHLHATHFRVIERSGGRGAVQPWEVGLKDTVLVQPQETVKVAVRFDSHPGLFLLHCHNLEHEDMGMMMNFQVE